MVHSTTGTWPATWLRWRSSGRTRGPQREDWNDHLIAAGCLRVCGRCPRCDEFARDGRRRRRVPGPAAVPRSRLDRPGLRDRRASRCAPDRRYCRRGPEGFRGGGPARQPDCAQPDGRPRLPLRGRNGARRVRRTAAFRVLSTSSTPGASFYSSQHLHAGLNYVRMRDGILLAATVRLPPGKTLSDGPFPTVIEYSGYNVAGPHNLIDALEGHASSSDPLLPDTSTVVGSVLAPLLGFVTVSVQMRGTGCSGGAFDLFGLPSDYDGYDVVQTVGAEPWVLNHKVGMVGISYSGFSQLVVAGTDPPDLAAITPLSPTDDLYSTGYPGGIYNDGFAASWVAQRCVGRTPGTRGRSTVGDGRDRHGRHDVPGQPAPASAGPEPRLAHQPGSRPDACIVQPALADGMGLAHQRACLHGRSARRRASRTTVAGADHRPGRQEEHLRHHDERDTHGLTRSRHHFALGLDSSTSTSPIACRPPPRH